MITTYIVVLIKYLNQLINGDVNFGIIVFLEIMKLKQETRDGQVFQGWHEGVIKFAPTYKYELNSDSYYGSTDDRRKGQKTRAPAW